MAEESALDEVIAATEKNQEEDTLELAKKIIRSFEGFEAKPYYATANEEKEGKLTIGYGSTTTLDGKPIKPGMRVSEKEAEQMLVRDLEKRKAVMQSIVKRDLTPRQEAAVLSLMYNAGNNAVRNSKFLKKLNAEGVESAREELWNWDKQTNPETGKKEKLTGLTERRIAEEALLTGEAPSIVIKQRPKKARIDTKVRDFGIAFDMPKEKEEKKEMRDVGIFDRNSTAS